MTVLSLPAARSLQLHVMGLAGHHRGLAAIPKLATKATLLRSLEQMQLLQLDTISVVNRSHHLVLYARCGAYPLHWLDQLLVDKKLFEVWAHEACLAPKSLLWLMRAHASERSHWSKRSLERVMSTDRAAMNRLLKHIRAQGPVKSSDFETLPAQASEIETPAKNPGWWNWKPHKRYLEAWFTAGKLMVLRREGFARVYDLAERVCPELIDPQAIEAAKEALPATQVNAIMQAKAVKALGIVPARWINDFFRTTPYVRDAQLTSLLDSGQLIRVTLEGSEVPWYVHRDHRALLRKASDGTLPAPKHCALLSPFDPLVWHRQRASDFFHFDYRIECYTPQAKRRFGYFTLPILYGDQLIGRVDAKAHRADGIFEIKALHFEASTAVDEFMIQTLAATINAFAHWHDCPQVQVRKVTTAKVLAPLRAALKQLALAHN